jgi:hypothetical protein
MALIDAEAMNRENPDTFWIPAADERSGIPLGAQVLLAFVCDDEDADFAAERMWVAVVDRDGHGAYTGTLSNHPLQVDLEFGDVVEFAARHVMDIELGMDPDALERWVSGEGS